VSLKTPNEIIDKKNFGDMHRFLSRKEASLMTFTLLGVLKQASGRLALEAKVLL
jgi:hypothetical protein